MEQALFLNRLDAPLPAGFQRLYFGSEFCPWTFPSASDIIVAVASARDAGVAFTLATPVVTEPFLPLLHRTLSDVLPRLCAGDEVLISDWGALQAVRRLAPQLPVVLGRVLSGQKRGPQILEIDLSDAQRDYFRKGSWYAAEGRALLAELGIARVELDNLLQGIAPLPAAPAGSLHHPFSMVTSSRNCPFRPEPSATGCPGGCGEVFTLSSPRSPLPLLQRGNTQFLRLDELPPDLAALGIDRLVLHPAVPC